ALDLLTLQTPKKKSPTKQYIFQRRTSIPTKSSGYDESSSLYVELRLTVSETESDEEVSGIVARVQDEGQAGPNPGEHDEGQAGPNPGEHDEGQAGPNPGDAAASQPLSSHVVHAGPNLKHMDLKASDTSIQPNTEQMNEEFTTTAYPNVQENLKLPPEGEVRHEEPASSTRALSSLQNLDKELSFTNQFLAENLSTSPHNGSSTTTNINSNYNNNNNNFSTTTTSTTIRLLIFDLNQVHWLYNLENLDIPHKVSKAVDEIITNAVVWALQASLKDRFRDLPEADMKEILHHRMWETNSYNAHEDHKQLYEALEKSMARDPTDQLLTDLAEAQKRKKRRQDSPKIPPGSPPHQPPPPPLPAGPSGTSGASGAPGSSHLPPPPPLSTDQSDQSKGTDPPSSLKIA
ncbi:hypothetical protein Tco_1558944, partial [Tanacetum coccineum]